ncbi:MAG: hypothetical protein KGK00_00410 [Paracoccaceae bacterium]|nr:hypothetical protein [Paracoccaceae bacterium]
MAGHDNAYSRVVFWLKILLPLAALVILSVMFLVARTIDPSRAIPFAKVDVTKIAREARISEPTYSGVTEGGSSVKFTASEVRPDAQTKGRSLATDPTLSYTSPSGNTASARSKSGLVDQPGNLATMTGDVTIDTSNDYHVSAPHMEATLDKTRLEATGGIRAEAPMGRITADKLTITPDKTAQKDYVLVFTGNVSLLYNPGN